jgi:hypothetical protein
MNAADQAIEEIRAVRRSISAAHGHDIAKYLADLRLEEQQHLAQLKRGAKVLAQRKSGGKKYPPLASEPMVLRERYKK